MSNWNKNIFIISMCIISPLLFGCTPSSGNPYGKTNFLIGTTVEILLYDIHDDKAIVEAFDRIREIENKMTINTPGGSEIIALNDASGLKEVPVSPDTLFVLEKGLYYSELSRGKFDITIGPVVKLWNIGTEQAMVPDDKVLEERLRLVDYKKLHLDRENNKAKLDDMGMMVDLGGIAKGYAADEAREVLKKHGIKSAIINLGGNILVIGENTNGEPFKIGIQNPLDHRGSYLGVLAIRDKTVVTSGIYEKNFEKDGVVYHHILDPATGYPANNQLSGVSIITDKSIDGDGLSTATFLLGLEEGMKFINGIPDTEAVFITKSKRIYITEGIRDSFTLTDEEYLLAN